MLVGGQIGSGDVVRVGPSADAARPFVLQRAEAKGEDGHGADIRAAGPI